MADKHSRDTVAQPAPAPAADPMDEVFPGGNPRTRSLPGQAPGEKQYEKVRESSGRLVSNKPSNAAYLSYQKYRAEQEDLARRRAAGEVIPEERLQWTVSGVLLAVFTVLSLTGMLGNFITGSPVWGRGKDIQRMVDKVWKPKFTAYTPEELAQYDGSDWTKPILVGLHGDVWDVTASKRLYGPEGAYHVMAGRDAARAFVTGCFQSPDHLVPDIRGFGEQEMQTLNNWKTFFENHEVYRKVGTVTYPPIDPSSPIPAPCTPGAGGGEDGTLGVDADAVAQQQDRGASANPHVHAHGHAPGEAKPDPVGAPRPSEEQAVGQKSTEEVVQHGRGRMGEL